MTTWDQPEWVWSSQLGPVGLGPLLSPTTNPNPLALWRLRVDVGVAALLWRALAVSATAMWGNWFTSLRSSFWPRGFIFLASVHLTWLRSSPPSRACPHAAWPALALFGLLLLLLGVFLLDLGRHRRLDGNVCNPGASQMRCYSGVLAVVAWPWPCRCSSMSWPTRQWRWCRHNLGYVDDAAA
jgi:hypothetical protein